MLASITEIKVFVNFVANFLHCIAQYLHAGFHAQIFRIVEIP